MKRVDMSEMKTNFSKLIHEVAPGEDLEVTENGVPFARIVPIAAPASRTFGIARHLFQSGEITIADDFDAH